VLAALLEARESGKGQVVDTAITDGAAHLMSGFHGWQNSGFWHNARQRNVLDGAAPNYDTYATNDGKLISVGALEPQFLAALLEGLGLTEQLDFAAFAPAAWPKTKRKIAEVIATQTQQHWLDVFDGTDACVAPVLDMQQALSHPHNQARGTYVDIAGVSQPAPAPRFNRSDCATPAAPHAEGADSDSVLEALGYSADDIAQMRRDGSVT